MLSQKFKLAALAPLALAGGTALASGNLPPPSGNLGSGAMGIDFFASNAPGASTEKAGGLANAIEAAFGGSTQQAPERGERK